MDGHQSPVIEEMLLAAAGGGSPPRGEIGSVLPRVPFSSLIPGWDVIEAQAQQIPILELRWPLSRYTYEAMRRDAQIEGMLNSVFLPIRHMEKYIDPAGARPEVAQEIARQLGLPLPDGAEVPPGNIDFDDHLRLGLLAVATGHQFFEIVGKVENEKFVLTGLKQRPPLTIERMNISSAGDLTNVWQTGSVPPPEIPAERLLTYVWGMEGANWAGRPMLYSLYRNWKLKDELLRSDVMTHRRLAGTPYMQTTQPGVVDKEAHETAAQIMQEWRAGEEAGVSVPWGQEPKILQAANSGSAIKSVEYHDRQMARAFMQMVAELGSTPNGSRALGQTLDRHYELGVLSVAKWAFASSQTLVRRIVDWNYGPNEAAPLIAFRDDTTEDISMADLVVAIETGLIEMTDELEDVIRHRSNLPPRNRAEPARALPGTEPPDANLSPEEKKEQEAAKKKLPPIPPVRLGGVREVAASAPKPGTPAAESKTDFQALQERHETTLEHLTSLWAGVQTAQIEALAQQIKEAPDTASLAAIAPPVLGAAALIKALTPVTEHGAQSITDSAKAQGHTLTPPDLEAAHTRVSEAAEATAGLLAVALGVSAASKATQLAGANLSPHDIASQTSDYLNGLSGAKPSYELAGLTSQAQNEGRFAAMEQTPAGTKFYASELEDSDTCTECAHEDGTEFPTLADARKSYPTGGFIRCLGGKRCRGTTVAIFPETPGQARDSLAAGGWRRLLRRKPRP